MMARLGARRCRRGACCGARDRRS